MNWDKTFFFKINGLVGKYRFLDIVGKISAKYLIFLLFLGFLFVAWALSGGVFMLVVLVVFIFTWLFGFILNVIIGLLVRRPRPYVTFSGSAKPLFRPKFENWKSFPSDHAMTVFVIFFISLFVFGTPWAWLFFPFVLLVCWARIFCGVHYPADIIGGMMVAFVSSALVFTFLAKLISLGIINN